MRVPSRSRGDVSGQSATSRRQTNTATGLSRRMFRRNKSIRDQSRSKPVHARAALRAVRLRGHQLSCGHGNTGIRGRYDTTAVPDRDGPQSSARAAAINTTNECFVHQSTDTTATRSTRVAFAPLTLNCTLLVRGSLHHAAPDAHDRLVARANLGTRSRRQCARASSRACCEVFKTLSGGRVPSCCPLILSVNVRAVVLLGIPVRQYNSVPSDSSTRVRLVGVHASPCTCGAPTAASR